MFRGAGIGGLQYAVNVGEVCGESCRFFFVCYAPGAINLE
jgi:hypothetical protein